MQRTEDETDTNNNDICVVLDDGMEDKLKWTDFPVRTCKVRKFDKKLPKTHRIFKTLTKQLFILGVISTENFLKLLECANKLEHLYITKLALCTENLMDTPRKSGRFRPFWDNLTKLAVTEIAAFGAEESDIMWQNLSLVLECKMKNLKMLSFTIYYLDVDHCLAFIKSVILFVANHPNLVTLAVKMGATAMDGDPEPLDEYWKQSLAQTKLESLTISTCGYYMRAWRHMINSMKTLKTLRVYTKEPFFGNFQTKPDNFLLDKLKEALAKNTDTLTTIELHLECTPSPLDARMFKEMKNLKRLVLSNFDCYKLEIINLKLLSPSLEYLKLENFISTFDEINELKINSHLENKKQMTLIGMGEHDFQRELPPPPAVDMSLYDFSNGRDPFDES